MFRTLLRSIVPLMMAAASSSASCGPGEGADDFRGAGAPPLNLVEQAEFLLEDPETPFQYLEQLTMLPDGGFVASDIVARKVRRFNEKGELLGQVGPPDLDRSDEWGPLSTGLASDGTLWINDRRGRMWNFDLEDGSAHMDSSNRQLLGFVISPAGAVVVRNPLESGELHLYKDGVFLRHFLKSDEHNLAIGGRASPAVTCDPEGNFYAIRYYDRTVFAFTPEGKQIRSWPVFRDRNFREVPRGFNPLNTTRDRNLLLAWHRTFTTFPRIKYVAGDRLAILLANDPPRRPNTLHLYSLKGEFLGSAEVKGSMVAAAGKDLFFSDRHLFFDGVCRITRCSLAE